MSIFLAETVAAWPNIHYEIYAGGEVDEGRAERRMFERLRRASEYGWGHMEG